MGQFGDLTLAQERDLLRIVAYCEEVHQESFFLTFATGENPAFSVTTRRPRSAKPLELQIGRESVVSISEQGYLSLVRGPDWAFALTRRAFDFASYKQRRRFGRSLSDLRWDLSHNDTLRSKIIWAIVAVVLSQLVYMGMKLLGWYT